MNEKYILIRSNRKTISIEIDNDLNVVVRAPKLAPKFIIEQVIESHKNWIEKHKIKKSEYLQNKSELSSTEIKELKEKAKNILPQKVQYYAKLMNVCPTGIKITSAEKRFGSCSGRNSICFSYHLMEYDDKAIDYVVVHELAHIKHHDHSKEFYSFISRFLPDYKEREKLLKQTPSKNSKNS